MLHLRICKSNLPISFQHTFKCIIIGQLLTCVTSLEVELKNRKLFWKFSLLGVDTPTREIITKQRKRYRERKIMKIKTLKDNELKASISIPCCLIIGCKPFPPQETKVIDNYIAYNSNRTETQTPLQNILLATSSFERLCTARLMAIRGYKSSALFSLFFKLTVHRRPVIKKAGLPRRGGAQHSGPLTLAFAPGRVSRVQNFCLVSGLHAKSLVNPLKKKS